VKKHLKWLIPVTAVLLIIGLAGADSPESDETGQPAATTTTTTTTAPQRAEPTTTAVPQRDTQTFDRMARVYAPEVSGLLGETSTRRLGDSLCGIAGEADDLDQFSLLVTLLMTESGVEEYSKEIAGLSAAAINFLCPEHRKLLD